MKAIAICTCVLCATPALAQQVVSPAPLGEPATTLYRQLTPDGRVIYSDKAERGATLDETLDVDPAHTDGLWSVEGSERPVAATVAVPTPVRQVASIPPIGRRKTVDEATSDVIRAEMLLEDARREQEAGRALLPGEKGRTGPGSSYAARQQRLAVAVARAEAVLEDALAAREALRRR